jgi:hypothetical protein
MKWKGEKEMTTLGAWLPKLFGVAATSGGYTTLATIGAAGTAVAGASAAKSVVSSMVPDIPPTPKAPKTPDPGVPQASQISSEKYAEARSIQRRRGLLANITTSGMGLLSSASTSKKKLLGE